MLLYNKAADPRHLNAICQYRYGLAEGYLVEADKREAMS
jgi:hypothetical protein